jgi:GNAT superfamily N-acetyltransferase
VSDVEIAEAVIPVTVESPDAAEFLRAIEIANEVEALAYGTRDMNFEPAEELPDYQDPFLPQRLLVARVDGDVVGRATVQPAAAGATSALVRAEVAPGFRRRGIGGALADAAEELARSTGHTTAIVFIGVPESPGPRIPAPTGFGSVPAADPGVAFLLARGYSFEQVDRVSRLDLPMPDLRDRTAVALRASGPDYTVRTWTGGTPPPWREDLALLATRMSTDAPSAALEAPEDPWTVERLVAEEERRDAGNPRRMLVAAAEHLPTGRVVAYSELSIPGRRDRAVHQYNTLVLREHRGHRLGMLVKLANLVHLERVAPGHPSVFTFNAEENRPMLDVNEAIGFVPIAIETAWQKRL